MKTSLSYFVIYFASLLAIETKTKKKQTQEFGDKLDVRVLNLQIVKEEITTVTSLVTIDIVINEL